MIWQFPQSFLWRHRTLGFHDMTISTAQISLVLKSFCQSVEVCLGSLSRCSISIEMQRRERCSAESEACLTSCDLIFADWSPVFCVLSFFFKQTMWWSCFSLSQWTKLDVLVFWWCRHFGSDLLYLGCSKECIALPFYKTLSLAMNWCWKIPSLLRITNSLKTLSLILWILKLSDDF